MIWRGVMMAYDDDIWSMMMMMTSEVVMMIFVCSMMMMMMMMMMCSILIILHLHTTTGPTHCTVTVHYTFAFDLDSGGLLPWFGCTRLFTHHYAHYYLPLRGYVTTPLRTRTFSYRGWVFTVHGCHRLLRIATRFTRSRCTHLPHWWISPHRSFAHRLHS